MEKKKFVKRDTPLKKIRIRAGKTQAVVAGELGVKKSTYSAWETGRISLNTDRILLLAEYYNCSPNEIVGYNNTDTPNYSDLSEEERNFLYLLNRLSRNNKNSILDLMESCIKKNRPRV